MQVAAKDGRTNPGFEDVDLGTGSSSFDHTQNGPLGNTNPGNQTEPTEVSNSDDNSSNGAAVAGTAEKSPRGAVIVRLDRSISLPHLVAILFAVSGGLSIFISPGPILQYSGSVGLSLIVWFSGGIVNLLSALCYTELGIRFPEAGGSYSYVLQTFGSMAGFVTLWGYIILLVCPAWALLAYVSAVYIVQPFFSGCALPLVGVRLLAGAIFLLCAVLNCINVKYISKIQIWFSGAKATAIVLIIVGGIYEMALGNTENFSQPFEGSSTKPGEIALAMLSSYFAYGGWQVIVNMMEESKHPERDLPRSVYISFTLIITLYCLTNMAYFSILSHTEITSTDAVGVLFISRLYSPLTTVISVLVAISSAGSLVAVVMGHSRLLFAAGRVGHMPSFVGMVHQKYRTPSPSIIILSFLTLVMLFTGQALVLMEYISLFSALMSVELQIILLYLRWKRTNETPSFQVPVIIAVLLLLFHLAVLVLSVYQKPRQLGIALAIIVSGIPVYWLAVSWKQKPTSFTNFIDTLTRIVRCTLDVKKTE
ncbi:Y+L amino acid transporter 2-like [Liolophura sinensis]|uniref:Y+L amino acid transporter 2-like n=1 Tax=Liolophura sinensis TaxID=3198878 RepID=UPI00315919F7